MDVARTGAAASVFGLGAYGQTIRTPSPAKKFVVVTFGGGARDEETFEEAAQRYIPRMLGELIPQATFFTQVVNRGILGPYVANASMATGCYETFDNFTPVSPAHPTLFEYYRRDRQRGPDDVWVIAPSNGFDRIGASSVLVASSAPPWCCRNNCLEDWRRESPNPSITCFVTAMKIRRPLLSRTNMPSR
jgi:hypothetical protein